MKDDQSNACGKEHENGLFSCHYCLTLAATGKTPEQIQKEISEAIRKDMEKDGLAVPPGSEEK